MAESVVTPDDEPKTAAHFLASGRRHSDKGLHTLAKENLRQAVALDPNLLDGHVFLGIALSRQHANEEALASLNEAVNLDSRSTFALLWRSHVLECLCEMEAALVDIYGWVALEK